VPFSSKKGYIATVKERWTKEGGKQSANNMILEGIRAASGANEFALGVTEKKKVHSSTAQKMPIEIPLDWLPWIKNRRNSQALSGKACRKNLKEGELGM